MIRLIAFLAVLIAVAPAAAAPPQLPGGVDPQNTIVIDTTQGQIIIKLRPDLAPKHVERIKQLVRDKYYDNVPFHRVIAGFMAQTGDGQNKNGTGGSKYPNLLAEFSKVQFKRGVVGMARADDPNSANSQFFIMYADGAFLNGKHTVIGEVTSGMGVVDKLKKGEPVVDPDRMISVQVAADAISSGSPSSPAIEGSFEDAAAALRRGDYATALELYRQLAEQGYARAQYNLGYGYFTGQGVAQNYADALKWYRKAAAQGYAPAQYSLGVLYSYGQGVPQDYAEAVNWYRKAADQGDPGAQSNLGYLYHSGYGVPQNYAEALKWYRKAAEQGGAIGQFNLGNMYEKGHGVPQNHVLAHMWFNLAASRMSAANGSGDSALNRRDQLASKMTAAQIAEAQTMSDGCLRSNYKDCKLQTPQIARRDRVAPPPVAQSIVVSTGTGFFVSENGHVVTNAHVVDGCQTVRSSRGGTLSKVSTDDASDLAVYIASEKSKAIARLRGGRGARAGESVVVVGFPLSGLLSSDPIVTTGIISALSGLKNDRRTIQITAPVQPGNSGGPLLGENGSVVGVVVSKLNAVKMAEAIGDIPQNVNFAVSLGTLQSFLNANGVPYVLDDSSATKSPADITAEASHYTVLLECLK